MVERLLELSIRQRALVVLLAAVFALLGVFAAGRVPIDAVPDVTNVQVQVITPAAALGPTDVETYVTFPVERAMAGLPGLEEVRSTSRAGISVVTLVFADDAELYHARDMVDQRLAEARSSIPESYGVPALGPVSSGLGEIVHFEVKGNLPLMERRAILEWQITPRLRLVPGVVEVNVFGGEAKTLELSLDPDRLTRAKVGVNEVVAAIRDNHAAVGGAYFVTGREHLTVRGEGRVLDAEDFGRIAIPRVAAPPAAGEELTSGSDSTGSAAAPLLLRDLGEVHYAPRVRYGAVTRDGRDDEAVVGVVMMLRGANSDEVATNVRHAIDEIGPTLPEGVSIDVYYDRRDLVGRTVHTVAKNLIEASVLVLAILLLTLGNFRAGVVVALAIPLALLGVFVGMNSFGLSANLVSLGAIDFGLVVDGAIIIVENAMSRLTHRREELGRDLTDDERREVVLVAAKEVRGATAFGEAIIALVYVPILALSSVEGRMFRPMALTVLFALATAFVLSLTLVPAIASWLLPRNASEKPTWLIRQAKRAYGPVLRGTLGRPRLLLGFAVGSFVAGIGLFLSMGSEFLPKLDEGTMVLAMVRLPSVSLEQSLESTRLVEKTMLKFPEVESVVCRTGRAEIAVDPMGVNMTDVYVMLKPKAEWTTGKDRDELIEKFDAALQAEIPGAGFAFSQPIEMNTNDLLAGIESDLALHLYGHDLGLLRRTADHMVRVLGAIPGAKDVRAEQIAGMNTLTVAVDRAALARHELSSRTVLDAVEALGGIEVGEIVEGGYRYPMMVRLSESARVSAEHVAELPVRTPAGALVPLGQLARIESVPSPSQISRERLQRRITVQLNVRGRDVASYVEQAKRELDREVKLPPGYFTEWAGEYERLTSATARLAVVIPVAIALILVLLMASFGRVGPSLLILMNVPFSLTGGIVALFVRGLPLSISAGVGFIALLGVAVLNGLVLVSRMERLRDDGRTPMQAADEGARERLRPVLTTALVASLGFLPMALATGAGAEVQRPLATVVIGGILTSTLLTLVVLPSLYAWLIGRPKKA